MKNKRIIAIIPARGGSKRLPKKNLIDVLGKPLIAYTIEAALKVDNIEKVIVSTDDSAITEVSKQYGADVPFRRPKSISKDNSKSVDVINHTLDFYKRKNVNFDYFILLQPTSPLRTKSHIEQALKVIDSKKCNSVISVSETTKSPLKAFTLDKSGFLRGIVNNSYPFMPQQSLPKCYYPNGAIYIKKISKFKKDQSLIDNSTSPFFMSQSNSLDIDTYQDIIEVERLLSLNDSSD